MVRMPIRCLCGVTFNIGIEKVSLLIGLGFKYLLLILEELMGCFVVRFKVDAQKGTQGRSCGGLNEIVSFPHPERFPVLRWKVNRKKHAEEFTPKNISRHKSSGERVSPFPFPLLVAF